MLKQEVISLGLYKAGRGGEGLSLAGMRDIAYDVELSSFNSNRPTVKEVVDELTKQVNGGK